jgi:hypothetical protein
MEQKSRAMRVMNMIMDTIYHPVCPYKHKEKNEHDDKHNEISKKGQEDQVQFRGHN